jgi:hypothetical protein
MTVENETIYNGAPLICPDCHERVPGPQVMSSPAVFYIGYGGCYCGPAYSRESSYFKTHGEATAILQAHPSEYTRLIDG